MQKSIAGIVARIEWVVDRIGQAASLLALVIIVLMACNVLLRYSLSLGTVWAQELEWHLLAALILFGMSYALLRGDNVRVDIFYSKYSAQTKRWVDIASAVLTMVIAVIMITLSWKYVGQSYAIAEKSPDPGGIPMRWLLKSLLPLGYGLLLLQSFGALLKLWFLDRDSGQEAANA
ncbi:MAG: TRAP transporter small permease subunit [Betaproteobacteria bacterium]|jgi:TRAP-type mannitol/chloroaromatic compound transport system permease small subunit|nr:TRAP transporter small permease subunit [Betaproteobacteria bacterium]